VAGTLQIPYTSVDEYRRHLEPRPGTRALVACSANEAIGIIVLEMNRSRRQSHVGTFYMAVRDDWQGKGVGTLLLSALLELADQWLNLERIEMQVYTDNATAIALYNKMGFQIEGTLRDYAYRGGRYVDAYAMARLRRVAAPGDAAQ
jgi:putative acetyltransferase